MTFEAIPDLLANILAEQKNTNEVLTRLVEAIAAIKAPAAAAKAESKKAIAKAAEPTAETMSAAIAEPPAASTAPTPAAPAALEYKKDVGPTFAKLLTDKGPTVVVDVLSRFGVKKGCELPVDQLIPALAAAQAALAA